MLARLNDGVFRHCLQDRRNAGTYSTSLTMPMQKDKIEEWEEFIYGDLTSFMSDASLITSPACPRVLAHQLHVHCHSRRCRSPHRLPQVWRRRTILHASHFGPAPAPCLSPSTMCCTSASTATATRCCPPTSRRPCPAATARPPCGIACIRPHPLPAAVASASAGVVRGGSIPGRRGARR